MNEKFSPKNSWHTLMIYDGKFSAFFHWAKTKDSLKGLINDFYKRAWDFSDFFFSPQSTKWKKNETFFTLPLTASQNSKHIVSDKLLFPLRNKLDFLMYRWLCLTSNLMFRGNWWRSIDRTKVDWISCVINERKLKGL